MEVYELDELGSVRSSLYARLADTVFFLDDSFGTDVLYYTAPMAIVDRGLKLGG